MTDQGCPGGSPSLRIRCAALAIPSSSSFASWGTKTILLRFADGDYSQMPERVASASHLGHLLTAPEPHDPPAPPQGAIDQVTGWWAEQIGRRLANPQATVAAMLELEDDEGRGLISEVWSKRYLRSFPCAEP